VYLVASLLKKYNYTFATQFLAKHPAQKSYAFDFIAALGIAVKSPQQGGTTQRGLATNSPLERPNNES
jgi:hypothetical protein